ncbi:hypothetical protein Tco_0834343, partial [Tanacetum coccineum]
TISAIENALGKVRDCQHGLYTAGGVSRVEEMILARERDGFAGKKYGATYKLFLGFNVSSHDDEEDTRSSQEYLNDIEEEYQERALLAKSKKFFKKRPQRFSSGKTTDDTISYKCGRKGYFARNCFSKTSVPSYSSPFQKPQTTIFSPSQQKPELRPNKAFEAKYNKVKAILALLSSDDNDMTEVKVLMALADDENVVVGKESARNEQRNNLVLKHRDLVQELNTYKEQLLVLKQAKLDFLTMQYALKLSKAEGFTLPNHDTGRIISAESQVKITYPLVSITDSLATKYDSADESSVCSTPLPPLKKLAGVEPIYGPKTIKSILKSNSTFKPETSKRVTINEPFSAPAKDNKNVSASKRNSAPTGKLKNVKIKDDIPLSIVIKELNDLKL